MAVPTAQRVLIDTLADEVPAIDHLRKEHLQDYNELLPHLLMADVARYVASYFGNNRGLQVSPPSIEDLRRTLALIDTAMASSDEAVQELISVSFLENLENESFSPDLALLLGNHLRQELQRRANS